jgi:predicted S18 family serine protease
LEYLPLLEIAKEKVKKKSRIKEYAIDALQNISDSALRDFAIEKLTTAKKPYKYVDILLSNYKEGDAFLLNKIAERFNGKGTIEGLAKSYIAIYTANKTDECLMPLTTLYKKMTCGLCRESILEILFNYDLIPDFMKAELQFDSNDDLRGLWEQHLMTPA